jgi:uncharacterized protein
MLIEFTVANFGSIKEPVALDMSPAQNIRKLPTNCFASGLPKSPRRLLRSAVIYGPNASGKTQMINAAYFMRETILNSNRKRVEDPIDTTPFILDLKTRTEPSAFQMVFVVNGQRHQYGFKVDKQRVCSEWLYIFPRYSGETLSFRREYNTTNHTYAVEVKGLPGFNDAIDGLPEDVLAITQFGQETKQRWPELVAAYSWFQQKLLIVHPDIKTTHSETLDLCEFDNGEDWVFDFLKAADLGIEKIQFKADKTLTTETSNKLLYLLENNQVAKLFSEEKKPRIAQAIANNNLDELKNFGLDFAKRELALVRIMSESGESVPFSMGMESKGTLKMLALAGSWKNRLNKGQVVFIDEFESSLHHKLARFLIELIHDPERNINGTQLVATTHDTALLDEDILRPDQIWLMNKNREHASRLYPLSDFEIKLKKGETLQKFYLDGLYGAVPMVRKRRLPVASIVNNSIVKKYDL